LQKLSEDYADKGFALVGVLRGTTTSPARRQFISDEGLTYPIVFPENFFLEHGSDIYAIPTTMFFDSEGKQVGQTIVGAKSYDDWAG
jgi:hypothetical protein